MFLPGTQNLTKDAEVLAAFQISRGGAKPESRANPPFDVQRLLDVILSAGAILFFAPLMIVSAIAIKLEDGGPVLFGQARVGYGGRTFKCWKFRSMVTDAEARLNAVLDSDPDARREWDAYRKLRNDPRVTKVGAFLRKTSLDELPQLFNILLGDMSVVGPRPIMPVEIPLYGRWISTYCRVRPALTGLWQVRGRNHLTFRQRVAMDMLYIRNASLGLYLNTLVRTVPAVLMRSGSY